MFTQEDFQIEAPRLSVVIMNRMQLPIMTPFKSLTDRQKSKFNKLMNEYIQSLGEDWKGQLVADFNDLAADYLDTFQAEREFVRDHDMTPVVLEPIPQEINLS
jgi:hypothetical protein